MVDFASLLTSSLCRFAMMHHITALLLVKLMTLLWAHADGQGARVHPHPLSGRSTGALFRLYGSKEGGAGGAGCGVQRHCACSAAAGASYRPSARARPHRRAPHALGAGEC